jgi:aspartyl/glutamyl-tRNA(Asn/Gln) amidotransferase C subunit
VGVLISRKSPYWKIDKKLVEDVSKIAKLKLKEGEIEKFTKELEDILKAFKKIDEVDTVHTKPSFHPREAVNVWREDRVKKWKWNALVNTKHKEKKYFKGPRIV